MRRGTWVWTAIGVLAAVGLAACGGSGGGSAGGGDTATVSGRLASPAAARAAAAGGPYYLEIVDESGTTRDMEADVTDGFRLRVPVGHDYVLVVGGAGGQIGAMHYGAAGHERSEFRVRGDVDLGEVEVDEDHGSVRCSDDSDIEEPDHLDRHDDDADGIPDHADDDHRNQCDRRWERGAELWLENGCGDCHGADGAGGEESIRGVNVNEIVHALKRGEGEPGDDEYMPAFPDLVRYGTDFRAFLGCDGEGAVCADVDAANGQAVFEANCAGCHVPAELAGEDADEIAEVLAEGEDEMPAMPSLVADAADIAAYLAGCPTDGGGTEPLDSDMDGVADDVDECPDTPAGATVDAVGCEVSVTPGDRDGDGVVDGVDRCEPTPAGAAVDATGCADSDGDGVFDYADRCAGTASGVPVDANGCEVVTPPPGIDGAQVFQANCAGCHGSHLGTGDNRDLTLPQKIAKIRTKVGGGHSGTTLSDAEFTALEAYLTGLAP